MRILRTVLLASLVVLLAQVALAESEAPEGKTLNPQFTAWSRFNGGSSCTYSMDVPRDLQLRHFEMTTMLREVTDEGVVLIVTRSEVVDGDRLKLPEQQVLYRQWIDKDSITQLADENLELLGKTVRCKVYEVSSGVIGGDNRTGGKSKVWLHESVPGGVIRAQMASVDGATVRMQLSKMTIMGAPPAPEEGPATQPTEQRRVPSGIRPGGELPLPSGDETAKQIVQIESKWTSNAANPVQLLSSMKGDGILNEEGVILLSQRQQVSSPQRYSPPVTFRAILFTDQNDLRLGYAADQVIFNWEMRRSELRVDGGPANGQHKPGAGALPAGKWVGIEWVVKPDEMILYVNAAEVYRAKGNFNSVHRPFSIKSHGGNTAIHSVEVLQ